MFVITKTAIGYNDEILYLEEGGKPVFASPNKQAAEAKLEELTRDFLSELRIGEYFYSARDEFSEEEIEILGISDDWDATLPEDLTDEQIEIVSQKLNFYELHEVNNVV